MVKNLPANAGDKRTIGSISLGQEDPLEKGVATTPVLPGESHRQVKPGGFTVHVVTKSWTRLKQLSMLPCTSSKWFIYKYTYTLIDI